MRIGSNDALLDLGSLTLSGGTAAFTAPINLAGGNAKRAFVVFSVVESAAGGTSVALKLQGSADGTSWTDIVTGPEVVLAKLAAGYTCELGIPSDADYDHIRAYGTVTGTFTAGKIAASIDPYRGE